MNLITLKCIIFMMAAPTYGFTPSHYSVSKITTKTNLSLHQTEKGEGVNKHVEATMDRRSCFQNVLGGAAVASFASIMSPVSANAAADCMTDCLKNCKLVAPKDPGYCNENCKEYCDQPDREDGLSGSVSSAKGETGILGTNTVVKGEDKPPSFNLPGLDFSSSKGKKLIGY